jgi:hypothetical protein
MKLYNLGTGLRIGYAIGVLALLSMCPSPAGAQENLDQGKSGAQLFASDCAFCHKSVRGLSKAAGPLGFGLEGFLREHYTASRESAAALARYIQANDTGPATAAERRTRRSSKGAGKPKAKESAAAASEDAKSAKSNSEAKSDKPEKSN